MNPFAFCRAALAAACPFLPFPALGHATLAVPEGSFNASQQGARTWVEMPRPGQDPRELKEPAPGVRIVQAPGVAAAKPAAAAIRAGSLIIEGPWARATPAGAKVAGGYFRVTNTGPEPDRLVGLSSPIAARSEVHEMSVTDGVMKMRPVDGGIEIKPGASVELKPGGFHLMFMDLRSGLKEGTTVTGTLLFEKAGPVEVTFQVGGLGSREAPSVGPSHH